MDPPTKRPIIHTMCVPEPSSYYSPFDEKAFFDGLHVPSVISIVGIPRTAQGSLNVNLDKRYLNDGELRQVTGVLARYGVDMSCLKDQCGPHNESWFKNNTEAFWHASVFGQKS